MAHLVEVWGYWAVALFVLAESCGVPLPGETAVIAAGVYAGHTHHLSPWLVFAAAAASALAGGEIGYLIGRFGGSRLVRRFGKRIRLHERNVRISRYLFDTYGMRVVFLGRFVSILRTYVALLAGTSLMESVRFSVANAASAIVWAGVFTLASYEAGNALERDSGVITWTLGGVAVVVIVVIVVLVRRRLEEIGARADAAYPPEATE